MSAPLKTAPAPFDARQLAETLDTMGLLIASLSDRVDAQGRMLEQVLQVATEARAAAFAAEKATDWKRNGDLINEGVVNGSRCVDELVKTMNSQLTVMDEVFQEVIPFLRIIGPRELKRRERLERLRRWMPAMLLGAVSVGVVLTALGLHAVGG